MSSSGVPAAARSTSRLRRESTLSASGGRGSAQSLSSSCAWVTKFSGSDLKATSTTERLGALGAVISVGHDAAHINGTSLVAISSAIARSNVEVSAAVDQAIPVVSRADILVRYRRDAPHRRDLRHTRQDHDDVDARPHSRRSWIRSLRSSSVAKSMRSERMPTGETAKFSSSKPTSQTEHFFVSVQTRPCDERRSRSSRLLRLV